MNVLNRATLRRFFVLGYDDMRARLTRRFVSAELAGDVPQGVWQRLEAAMPVGTVRGPRNYPLQMSAYAALKRLKAKRSIITLLDAKAAVGIGDGATDGAYVAIASSEIAMLIKALIELTPRRREILLASRLDGIQPRAIAERLDVSRRLVEVELKHALAHCALRVDRRVMNAFGPRPPRESQAEEESRRIAGPSTPKPTDIAHASAADISELPAAFLTPIELETHDWLLRFAIGSAGAADLEAFKIWSAQAGHTEAFARACRLWAAVEPASRRVAAGELPTQRGMGRRAFVGGALAASAAAVACAGTRPPLGLWPSLSELAADYRTAPGEQRKFVLAGGTSIELNTRTSVVVKGPAGDGIERIELIGGEAVIATRFDQRSAVQMIAGDGRVTAADAAFNIRYECDVVCTTCVRGEIEVAFGGRLTSLRHGEQVVYASGSLGVVTKVDAAAVTAWKDGMLVFRSAPLADAVAEVNRYRPGRIIVTNEALGRRLFNARFRIAHVDGVVAQIQQIFGASVTILPGGIVLLG